MSEKKRREIIEEVQSLYEGLDEKEKESNTNIVIGRHTKMLSDAFHNLDKFKVTE